MKFKRLLSLLLVFAMLSAFVVTASASDDDIMLLSYKYTKKCVPSIVFNSSNKTAHMSVVIQGLSDCPRITGFVRLYHQGWFGIWHLDKSWDGTEWGDTFTVDYDFTYTSGVTYKVTVDVDVYSGTVNDCENVLETKTFKAP